MGACTCEECGTFTQGSICANCELLAAISRWKTEQYTDAFVQQAKDMRDAIDAWIQTARPDHGMPGEQCYCPECEP